MADKGGHQFNVGINHAGAAFGRRLTRHVLHALHLARSDDSLGSTRHLGIVRGHGRLAAHRVSSCWPTMPSRQHPLCIGRIRRSLPGLIDFLDFRRVLKPGRGCRCVRSFGDPLQPSARWPPVLGSAGSAFFSAAAAGFGTAATLTTSVDDEGVIVRVNPQNMPPNNSSASTGHNQRREVPSGCDLSP